MRATYVRLARALLAGLGYGLTVTLVDLARAAMRTIGMGMPPQPMLLLSVGISQIVVGTLVGLLTMAALRGRLGWLWQLLAMVVVWVVLGRWLALDPSDVWSWLAVPLLGFGLAVVGRWMLRWRPLVGGALAIALLVLVVAAPSLVSRWRRTPTGTVVAAEPVRSDLPNVVVVVLDTVRAASMSAYGYERPTTPFFERLAAESTVFDAATSPSTWSLPSHASLFTGQFPSGHGAHGEHRRLGAELPTLAQVLAGAGYETLCFTANPHISDGFGLTRGFVHQDEAWRAGGGGAGRGFFLIFRLLDRLGLGVEDKGGGAVAESFRRWLDRHARARERPFFAFINFLEAHFPYHQLPRAYLRRFTSRSDAELQAMSRTLLGAQFGRLLDDQEIAAVQASGIDMYDAGILYTDHLLEQVVTGLADTGVLDATVLVVLADHGELLGEQRSFGHGASLAEPDLHVPLLVRFPPRVPAGTRVVGPVSTLGVFGTILDLASLDPPPTLQVGSLLPALDGGTAGDPVLAERFVSHGADRDPGDPTTMPLARRGQRYRTYRAENWKLVEVSDGTRLLFDLAGDPHERDDLSTRRPDQLARMTQALAEWRVRLGLPPLDAEVSEAAVPEVDAAVRERLEALGYAD